jgi:hypothetical protein
MAHQKQVISWLEELVPEIKRTRDPEATMLKFATDRNLSPAQLEKLAQVYNTAKTINFLEKSANRGDRFHVVDASALVAKYASAAPADAGVKSDVNEWCFKEASTSLAKFPEPSVKAASEAEEHSVVVDSSRRVVRSHLAEQELFQRNKAAHDEMLYNARADAAEKLASVVENLRKDYLTDFSAVERDALFANPSCKEACDLVAERLKRHGAVKRASDAGGRRLLPQTGHHCGIVELQGLLEVSKEASRMHAEFMKTATVGTAAGTGTSAGLGNQNPQKPRSSNPKPDKPGKPSGGSGGGGKDDEDPLGLVQLIRDARAPNLSPDPAGLVGNMLSDVLSGRKNRAQEKVDSAADDDRASAVISTLMFSDPIISQAEPEEVISLANSIRNYAPELATDVNAMRAELREKLQMGSIPGMAVKEYSGIQKTIDDDSKVRGEAKRDRYSIPSSKVLA